VPGTGSRRSGPPSQNVAEVRLSSHARKSYEKLARSDPRIFLRVDRALDRLAREPDAGKPLQGPLRGRRSMRVGSVRIIYRFEKDELLVLVLEISRRAAAYR
jgi:mRNA-degrading endonuclease RelE of RelBE toxin-antitoxin system